MTSSSATRLKPKRRQIPITVLTGFLGSGKTTLLNYILMHNQGLKIGVVVNDFGAINIDSKLVTAQTDSKLELSNGCICCSLNNLDLQEAIGQFVYPDSPIDYIVIEASGLADPYDLLVTLRDNLGSGVRLDSIVALIDAYNIEHNAEANQLALKQAEYADFVVVNKIDLVTKKKAGEIDQLIRAINPRARVFTTVRGELDLHLILDSDAWQGNKHANGAKNSKQNHDHSKHAHEQYMQISFVSDKPLDPMKFQQFVNQQMPTEVYRAKGVVDLGHKGHDRKYIFHLVGARSEIAWQNWRDDESPETNLVFIGRDIDETALRTLLQSSIDPNPDEKLAAGYEVRLPKKAD